MMILGLSSFPRESSATLFVDGTVRAAIENKKLVRGNTKGLPQAAARFCLDSVGADWRELNTIAVANNPVRTWMRRTLLYGSESAFAPFAAAYREVQELGVLAQNLHEVRILRHNPDGFRANILCFDHHLCHAAAAFFLSPFERSLILTLDGEGDGIVGVVAIGEGTRIRILERIVFPNSVGWLYSQVTKLLGFKPGLEEHKTQWLSLKGQPVFKDVFLHMIRQRGGVLPNLNRSFLQPARVGHIAFSHKFYREVALSQQDAYAGRISSDHRCALAASIQHACGELVAHIVEHYRRRESLDSLCLGGGVFLNCILVADLESRLRQDRIFVPPAPGNAGCAIGAAALAWHRLHPGTRMQPPSHPYWGPRFSHAEVKEVLDNCKVTYSLQNTEARKVDSAVQLLHAGKIIAWYQGEAEFGPRALGNRSILASPWAPYVKENLNDFIKHRESFRPFALTVTEEDCPRYFEASKLTRLMNSLARVRREAPVQDFVLPGGRVRLHVVQRDSNPLFWQLLKRFGEHAPAPILINTSFNLFGEPLVITPRDALRSYSCSGIDALVLDSFVLSKKPFKALVSEPTKAVQMALGA